MPTYLYNNEYNLFRRKMGKGTAGSTSDKAKTQETDADCQKKRGPHIGHDSISHNRTI